MKITDKEYNLIKGGKIHAVLRWNKSDVEEKVGDVVFSVDGQTYRLTDKKRWKVFRCGAERSHIDWSCDTIYDFKVLMGVLYKPYPKIKDDTCYLCIFKADKQQRTLGV